MISSVEPGYNVIKGVKSFMSLQTSVFITEECNVMVNIDDLIGTTEYLTVQVRFPINRSRYNRDRLYIITTGRIGGKC
jgi:hypothetical protein